MRELSPREHCVMEPKDSDLHTQTAAKIFGCSPDLVTPDQRRAARAANFGLLWGQEALKQPLKKQAKK